MYAFMGKRGKVPQITPTKCSSISGQQCRSGDQKPLMLVLVNVLPRVRDDLIAVRVTPRIDYTCIYSVYIILMHMQLLTRIEYTCIRNYIKYTQYSCICKSSSYSVTKTYMYVRMVMHS